MITDEVLARANHSCSTPWTREKLTYVKEAYAAKLGINSIGEKLGFSNTAITRALTILGVTIRARGRIPQVTEEQKREIARLLKTYNQREVAELVGVGMFVVNRVNVAEKRNAQHQVH